VTRAIVRSGGKDAASHPQRDASPFARERGRVRVDFEDYSLTRPLTLILSLATRGEATIRLRDRLVITGSLPAQ
jgi:hypothetical protein